MIIDAHQHFWSTQRSDYGWLTPAQHHLWRDFLPDNLAPLLKRHGIEKTILVQAAPTEAETEFLLTLADKTPFVAGVVGWIDWDVPHAPDRVAAMAARKKLVGLRPMVQDMADEAWLARPGHAAIFEAMTDHGLVFDALVLPHHLPHLQQVIARHPALPVVIDHGAKPHIRDRRYDPWRQQMADLARHDHVVCKLSGLVTEAATDWQPDDLQPYVDHLLNIFGPARLIWGSDWPVVTGAASYARWHDTAQQLLSALSSADRDRIFGGNAARMYLTKDA